MVARIGRCDSWCLIVISQFLTIISHFLTVIWNSCLRKGSVGASWELESKNSKTFRKVLFTHLRHEVTIQRDTFRQDQCKKYDKDTEGYKTNVHESFQKCFCKTEGDKIYRLQTGKHWLEPWNMKLERFIFQFLLRPFFIPYDCNILIAVKIFSRFQNVFLAVQNSSIGDLVTHSLTDSLTVLLLLTYKERP